MFVNPVSVPLRGTTFLNSQIFETSVTAKYSFRPLTGNYISQLFGDAMEEKKIEGFRPLTGNYISQYHLPHPLYSLADLSQMRVKKFFKKCSLMESKIMLIIPLSTGIAGNRGFFNYFNSASSHLQCSALISCAFQDMR